MKKQKTEKDLKGRAKEILEMIKKGAHITHAGMGTFYVHEKDKPQIVIGVNTFENLKNIDAVKKVNDQWHYAKPGEIATAREALYEAVKKRLHDGPHPLLYISLTTGYAWMDDENHSVVHRDIVNRLVNEQYAEHSGRLVVPTTPEKIAEREKTIGKQKSINKANRLEYWRNRIFDTINWNEGCIQIENDQLDQILEEFYNSAASGTSIEEEFNPPTK